VKRAVVVPPDLLIMNGIEAMSAVSDRPRGLVIRSGARESGLELTVQDSGIGLDPQNVDHIFDTFFTTKPNGMAWACPSTGRSSRRIEAACGPAKIPPFKAQPFGSL